MAGEDALFQRFGREFRRGDVLFREGEPGIVAVVPEGVVVPDPGKMQKDLDFLEMKERFED
jgi:hypothetical protein